MHMCVAMCRSEFTCCNDAGYGGGSKPYGQGPTTLSSQLLGARGQGIGVCDWFVLALVGGGLGPNDNRNIIRIGVANAVCVSRQSS